MSRPRQTPVNRAAMSLPRSCARSAAIFASWKRPSPSRETRVAVELLIDTGRLPAEICTLGWDCLVRDAAGTPVLVYDNSKAHRLQRRLPISEHTATLITDQKLAVRERFPATPSAQLKPPPSRRLNPAGSRPVTRGHLSAGPDLGSAPWDRCGGPTAPSSTRP